MFVHVVKRGTKRLQSCIPQTQREMVVTDKRNNRERKRKYNTVEKFEFPVTRSQEKIHFETIFMQLLNCFLEQESCEHFYTLGSVQ